MVGVVPFTEKQTQRVVHVWGVCFGLRCLQNTLWCQVDRYTNGLERSLEVISIWLITWVWMEVPRDGEQMKGSRGPRPEPWGTPINNGCVEATAQKAGRWAGRELFHAVLRALEEEAAQKNGEVNSVQGCLEVKKDKGWEILGDFAVSMMHTDINRVRQ